MSQFYFCNYLIFYNSSFVTIWVLSLFEFCHTLICHNLSCHILSLFTLGFVSFLVLSYFLCFDNLSFVTVWVLSHFEFCQYAFSNVKLSERALFTISTHYLNTWVNCYWSRDPHDQNKSSANEKLRVNCYAIMMCHYCDIEMG